jgi:hypothetical protein
LPASVLVAPAFDALRSADRIYVIERLEQAIRALNKESYPIRSNQHLPVLDPEAESATSQHLKTSPKAYREASCRAKTMTPPANLSCFSCTMFGAYIYVGFPLNHRLTLLYC